MVVCISTVVKLYHDSSLITGRIYSKDPLLIMGSYIRLYRLPMSG